MRFNRLFLLGLLITVLVSGQVLAEDLTGEEIIDRTESLSSVDDLSADLEMKIIRSGRERVRELTMVSQESDNGIEKSLIRFLSPSDVRGTGFLSIDNPEGADEQYLYLPALGKPRRISSEDRGGKFMGSDLTYEDISPSKEDYNHQLIGTETIDDNIVYLVESTPVTEKIKEDVGFAKKISYIRKDIFTLVKAEYFDDQGKVTRRLVVSNLKKISDDLWFGTYMVMEDLVKKSKTILEYNNIEVNTGIRDDFFSIRQLTRPAR